VLRDDCSIPCMMLYIYCCSRVMRPTGLRHLLQQHVRVGENAAACAETILCVSLDCVLCPEVHCAYGCSRL